MKKSNSRREEKKYQDFINEMLLKGDNPYNEIKNPQKYIKFRNLSVMVIEILHKEFQDWRWYQEHQPKVWTIMKNTVMAVLYVQSQIKDETN